MAGKEGAARERLEAVVEALGATLLREARVLAELAPSSDAAAAEKVAKAAKAISDAGRSLAALAVAAAPATEPPVDLPAGPTGQDAGTDMDDEHPQWDADELARRRERLVERFAFGPLGANGAAAGDGGAGLGCDVAALAVAVAPRPAPA